MKKGLTMVEIMVAMSIFVVASIIIVSLFVSHSKLFSVQERVGSMKLHKTLFTKHLREIGEVAKNVVASITIGSTPYTSSTSTVIFQLSAIDAGGEIISGTYDYVVFYREGNTLFMETDADVASQRKDIKQKVADKVDNATFRYDTVAPAGANMVSGYLYLKSGVVEEEIGTSVYLRNK